MELKTVAMTLLVSVLLALVPAGGAHEENERSAQYISFGAVDHGVDDVPKGVLWASCDTEGWMGLDTHQGIGGVFFCDIAVPSTIHILIEDEVTAYPGAAIYCDGEQGLGKIQKEATIFLPEWCGDGGTARVAAIISGPPDGVATTGTVYLTIL